MSPSCGGGGGDGDGEDTAVRRGSCLRGEARRHSTRAGIGCGRAWVLLQGTCCLGLVNDRPFSPASRWDQTNMLGAMLCSISVHGQRS